MSMHFSANQYEQSFRAPRLGNWEVRKWYPHERPRARRGHTKIIANDRGHLLPGVPRVAPWGHFQSTWQLPKRITRKLAKELVSARSKQKEKTSWEKRSFHRPLIEQESSTPPLPPPPTKKERKYSASKDIPIVEERTVELPENFDKDEHDYTNPVGVDRTPKVINTAQRCREDIESYTKNCKVHPEKKNILEKLISDKEYSPLEAFNGHNDNDSRRSDDIHSLKSKDSKKDGSLKSIDKQSSQFKSSTHSVRTNSSSSSRNKYKHLETDFISAQYAKDLAQNNLKHRPLPDAVENKLYRALQMQQVKNPGAELEDMPIAAAVGHKKYVSPGPTQCSKLKVYRPKTAAPLHLQTSEDERPKTSKAKELNEIDLAICWDFAPLRPEDEPKRPVHIDGSNRSIAPGIFTIVKHPEQETPSDFSSKTLKNNTNGTGKHKLKTAWPDINDKGKPVNASAVMDIINNNTEDLVDKKVTEHNPHSHKKSSKDKYNGHLVPINGTEENNNPNVPSPASSLKSSRNGGAKCSRVGTLETSSNSDKLTKNSPKARSSPNLHSLEDEKPNKVFYTRPCMACETKSPQNSKIAKPEYKMAFKAGVPNSRSNSNNGSQSSNKNNSAKPLNVPKPKTPFARKSYSINTLAPPFSLWPGTTGMDYPEHWRLASVYQQSYKPVELRKNPMIKGIFR